MNIQLNENNEAFVLPVSVKSGHIRLFERLHKSPDNTTTLEKCLLVLSTPRSGSTLFCEALNNTGLLGVCDEWLNYEYFSAWSQVVGRDTFFLPEYLQWLERKTVRGTGVFCLKLHVGQLIAMNEDFKMGIESMDFDHVVYTYRRDKLAQAVSLAKATSTNQFRSYETPMAEANVSRTAVADGIKTITQHDEFVRNHLWHYVDVQYAYEDFQQLDTPQMRAFEGYRDVLDAFGKDRQATFQVKRLKKQADHVNELAIEDFRSYLLGEVQ